MLCVRTMSLQKYVLNSWSPGLQNVTFFRNNRSIVDIINQNEIMLRIGWGPLQSNWCPPKMTALWSQRHAGRIMCDCTGWIYVALTPEITKLPVSHQNLRRGKKGFPCRFRGSPALLTLLSRFCPPRTKTINFCHLSHPVWGAF